MATTKMGGLDNPNEEASAFVPNAQIRRPPSDVWAYDDERAPPVVDVKMSSPLENECILSVASQVHLCLAFMKHGYTKRLGTNNQASKHERRGNLPQPRIELRIGNTKAGVSQTSGYPPAPPFHFSRGKEVIVF